MNSRLSLACASGFIGDNLHKNLLGCLQYWFSELCAENRLAFAPREKRLGGEYRF